MPLSLNSKHQLLLLNHRVDFYPIRNSELVSLFSFVSNVFKRSLIMLHTYKTRVVRLGAFWQVQRQVVGKWETMRDLFGTRAQARKAQFYWARM